MGRHLVLVLPSKNSNEFPYDYETAEMIYGSILEGEVSRLTFVDIEDGFSSFEDLPEGIEELLEEKEKAHLIGSSRVVSIEGMDPLRKDWGSLMSSYFRPLLSIGSEEVEVTYQLGPGSALLTGMMVGLASSTESKIIANSPFDVDGVSSAIDIEFVKRGSGAYSELFGGVQLGKRPRKDSAFQRNILVRMLEEGALGETYSDPVGKWMTARQIASGEGMPESAQGIGAPMGVLEKLGLVCQNGGGTEDLGRAYMRYSLTPEGIVAALETRRHHNSAFGRTYDPVTRGPDEERQTNSSHFKREAKGVIVGFRIEEEVSEVSQGESEEHANRILNSFDYVAPVLCHIGSESRTRFMEADPREAQKNLYETIVNQRGKGINDKIFYSICGPDWDPRRHFSSVIESLMGLPPNVEWSVDLTRLSAWDQVVFSIASNLLEMPLIYSARDRGKGSRGGVAKAPDGATIGKGLLHVKLPSHQTWRLIRDLNEESAGGMRDLPTILGSINRPTTDYVIFMSDFNRITGSNDKENSRVSAKLDVPRTFVQGAFDSGGGKTKFGWALTESGVIASKFIRARKGVKK